MRRPLAAAIASLLVASCASAPDTGTLAELNRVAPDVAEVEVADSLDLALQSYRRYLEETQTSAMTPEAMRQRLKRARTLLARRLETSDASTLTILREVLP